MSQFRGLKPGTGVAQEVNFNQRHCVSYWRMLFSGRFLHDRVFFFIVLCSSLAGAASSVQIPRVSRPPRLDDFEGMKPHGAAAELRKLSGFTQQAPSDGKPASDPTDIYVGYDATNLYLVWVCWDADPHAIRAHLSRREGVTPPDDDYVELTVDTFHDQRHGFLFDANFDRTLFRSQCRWLKFTS